MKLLLHPSLWGADSLAMTPSQRGSAPELLLLLAEPPLRRPGEKRQSVIATGGTVAGTPQDSACEVLVLYRKRADCTKLRNSRYSARRAFDTAT